jgi:hypothetical protein
MMQDQRAFLHHVETAWINADVMDGDRRRRLAMAFDVMARSTFRSEEAYFQQSVSDLRRFAPLNQFPRTHVLYLSAKYLGIGPARQVHETYHAARRMILSLGQP